MLFDLEHLEVDEAVINGDTVALLNIADEILIVDGDRALFDIGAEDREIKDLAGFELHRGFDLARADLGALKIDEDGDGIGELLIEALDISNDLEMRGVIAMGHIEARYIHPRERELTQGLARVGAGSDRANDLGEARSLHRFLILSHSFLRVLLEGQAQDNPLRRRSDKNIPPHARC